MKKIAVLLIGLGLSFAGLIPERIYMTPIANGKWQSANFTIIGTGNVVASANNSSGLNFKPGLGLLDVAGTVSASSVAITGTLTANKIVAPTISGNLTGTSVVVAGTVSASALQVQRFIGAYVDPTYTVLTTSIDMNVSRISFVYSPSIPSLNGLAGGVDGQELTVFNSGASSMSIENLVPGATQQIATPGAVPFIIRTKGLVKIKYVGSIWYVIAP
jgi:hypothetical protein